MQCRRKGLLQNLTQKGLDISLRRNYSSDMHIWFAGIGICLAISPLYAQGKVSLKNLSRPFTSIEVGNIVELRITGAAPNGVVTVVQNGQAEYTSGTTDASGNWSTTAEETQAYVGIYKQIWKVNGVALTPDNPDLTWFLFAPTLPDFEVFSQNVPSSANDPIRLSSDQYRTCGAPQTESRWIWSPVTYSSNSSWYPSAAGTAAGRWNSVISSKMSFSPNSEVVDIIVADGNVGGQATGGTVIYTAGCNSGCYRKQPTCGTGCFNEFSIYRVDVYLSTVPINYYASAMGVQRADLAATTATHEFGHLLQLDHPAQAWARCSDVLSVLYPSIYPKFSCGITSPTERDVRVFASVYPTPLTVCPIDPNYCSSSPCS